MNCCYTIWSDIIIPLIAALIGGGLTLIGVIWTIKAEKKKDKKAYLERIRPFFVLENPDTLDLSKLNIKKIWVKDDSAQDVQPDQIVFHWDGLLISNMCDSVCMVSYIKINDTEYASFGDVPIKPGDFCEIRGFPFSAFIRKYIDRISIGFLDKDFNLYEYKVAFEVREYQNHVDGWKEYCHKAITFSLIDCRTNLVKSKRRAKV